MNRPDASSAHGAGYPRRRGRPKLRHLAALLLPATTALSLAQAAAPAAPPVWTGVWRGTIGTAAVQVCLQHTDYDDFGAYYYLRHLGIISLGKLGAQPVWTEARFSDKAAKGPLWHFTAVSAGHLQGSWSDGAKTLPFTLDRIAMARPTPDGDDTPCGNATFSLPRFTKPVITTKAATLKGIAYTRVLADPGKQFEDSATETFQLPGTSPAIRHVNAELYKPIPTGPDDASYFTCSMAALGQNGLDGDASTTITPLIITADWLVLQDSESDDCGGAHPNSDVTYESWDLRKGVKLNLYDWFTKAALTQTINDPGTKDAYTTVAFTASFKHLIVQAFPPGDADCKGTAEDADSWDPRLTESGIAFAPELPHATQACADDAIIPLARLAPFLTPAGKTALTAFLAQARK